MKENVFLLFLAVPLLSLSGRSGVKACTFPSSPAVDIPWGVSTAAFQVEGATTEGGRGPSIWDTFSHQSGHIAENANADTATDFYHRYSEDISDHLHWLSVPFFRMSLSWPRLLPTGHRRDGVNPDGLLFYDDVFTELEKKNITPLVTLFHWDLPQALQDEYGGWESDRIYADFVDYVDLCFDQWGDRIQWWITLNEPLTVATLGYATGTHAPGKQEPSSLPYQVAHRMITAHALVYRHYHDHYAQEYGGKISIALNSDFIQPRDPSSFSDRKAAERALLWRMGWFADPLFFGTYPEEMQRRLGPRCPQWNASIEIKDTLDFFSLNHYTTLEATASPNQDYTLFQDAEVFLSFPADSVPSASDWLRSYPPGIKGMVYWIWNRYYRPNLSKYQFLPFAITEVGISTHPWDDNHDPLRVTALQQYYHQFSLAVQQLGIEPLVFSVWSWIDNFEWARGYTERFGLFHVDMNPQSSTYLKRTPRESASIVRNLSLVSQRK